MLVLLPTLSKSLLAQWQEPYWVVCRVGGVIYEVDMADIRTHTRVIHVNSKWYAATAYWMEEGAQDEIEEVSVWKAGVGQYRQLMVGLQLSEDQRKELQTLLFQFTDVLQDKSGKTHLMENSIEMGTAPLICQATHHLPHAYRKDSASRTPTDAGNRHHCRIIE